jgi:cell fate regulator YaaT (PSP1 superfamily)
MEVPSMPDVVGIRFKSGYKIYDFEVNEEDDVKVGDLVVVESDFGLSIGNVVKPRHFVEFPERKLKKILRIATEEDIKTSQENKIVEKEGKVYCLERIMARGLQMKLIDVEATLDKRRIIFYFTADGRIDFRELVKDLASRYKTRIEMRQIGVRDEAKYAGGIGICGRELCCKTFLTSFEPISIKMAKKQELVLNIGKLSGLCGRLMCCLRFEHDGEIDNITADYEIPPGAEEESIEIIAEQYPSLKTSPEMLVDNLPNQKELDEPSDKTITAPQTNLISEKPDTANNKKSHFRFKKRRKHKK